MPEIRRMMVTAIRRIRSHTRISGRRVGRCPIITLNSQWCLTVSSHVQAERIGFRIISVNALHALEQNFQRPLLIIQRNIGKIVQFRLCISSNHPVVSRDTSVTILIDIMNITRFLTVKNNHALFRNHISRFVCREIALLQQPAVGYT